MTEEQFRERAKKISALANELSINMIAVFSIHHENGEELIGLKEFTTPDARFMQVRSDEFEFIIPEEETEDITRNKVMHTGALITHFTGMLVEMQTTMHIMSEKVWQTIKDRYPDIVAKFTGDR